MSHFQNGAAHVLDGAHARDASPGETMPARAISGFTSEIADIGGVRLHYRVGGDQNGPPVLLWHGFLSTGYAWRKVMTVLADAGLAVLVPDMRGFGDSDKPPGTEGYDARALADDFRALARRIGFGGGRPITLVAHDLGAPPALLWAADYPEGIAGLVHMECPVMVSGVLMKILAYTPEAMKNGSMWWWIVPLAPGVPEALVVGNERAFVNWFYEGATAVRGAIEPETVNEYLRTFSGREGVLGAMGIYRAAFVTVDQTAALLKEKVKVPVVALGGDKALGANVLEWVKLVAASVTGDVIADCGHFIPEERPRDVVRHVLAMTGEGRRR
jgi:pimeloyl-ACP methyl ester carboxylesterase